MSNHPTQAPAAPEAPSDCAALPFAILADELAALHRFYETTEDGQDYDVPVPMMKRLAIIGLVRRVTGNRYDFTDFGLSVRNGDFDAVGASPERRLHCVGYIEHYGTEIRDLPKGKQCIPVYVRASDAPAAVGASVQPVPAPSDVQIEAAKQKGGSHQNAFEAGCEVLSWLRENGASYGVLARMLICLHQNNPDAPARRATPVQPVLASLSDALLGAANYIDVLGGDSQKYRVVLASSTPTTGDAS